MAKLLLSLQMEQCIPSLNKADKLIFDFLLFSGFSVCIHYQMLLNDARLWLSAGKGEVNKTGEIPPLSLFWLPFVYLVWFLEGESHCMAQGGLNLPK